MTPQDKQAFVDGIVQEHGQGLRRFLAARLRRSAADIPDLVQEVYLRLLRIPNTQTIRSPRAYLFTVALHVLYQHQLNLTQAPDSVDLADILPLLQTRAGDNPPEQLENQERLQEFDRVLSELPQQTYTVFVLHRQYGYSREEIAAQLGLSYAMVKKHLALALIHCRRRFEEME